LAGALDLLQLLSEEMLILAPEMLIFSQDILISAEDMHIFFQEMHIFSPEMLISVPCRIGGCRSPRRLPHSFFSRRRRGGKCPRPSGLGADGVSAAGKSGAVYGGAVDRGPAGTPAVPGKLLHGGDVDGNVGTSSQLPTNALGTSAWP
jgi:hypothetical protein